MKAKGFDILDVIMKGTHNFKGMLYGLFVYLDINTETISILATLMVIDTFFGSVKTFRIDYTKFKFKLLLLGFCSKIAFLMIPVVVAFAGKGLGYELKVLVDISIKILIASETISIISNAIAIKTKKDTQDYDIITTFLKYLRNVFVKVSEALLVNLKDKP
jgi:hypothetical protein